MLKDRIEILNFTQIIQNITRSWRNQADSLLDHIWVGDLNKVIKHWNKVRNFSDHHHIGLTLRVKGYREKTVTT